MTNTNRPSSLLLLLLAAMTLLISSSPAQAASNSSTNLEAIATIAACTDSQADEIDAILASNTNFQDCQTNVGSENIFNLTDPLVLCNDTACVAGLQSLYNDLPECRYGSIYAFQYISSMLLTNCGIAPVNDTASYSSSWSDSDVTSSSFSGSTSPVPTATPTASTASPKPTSSSASSGSRTYQQYFAFALASMALGIMA